MIRFRQFIEDQDMSAAPAAPTPAPPSPAKSFDNSIGDREQNISPEERDAIDVDGEMLISNEPLVFDKHGIRASAPMYLQITKKYPDHSADVMVKYTLSNKQKLMNLDGSRYLGTVTDKMAHLPKNVLDRIRLKAFDSQAQIAAAPPGGVPNGPI
jgi:hypothetical protein